MFLSESHSIVKAVNSKLNIALFVELKMMSKSIFLGWAHTRSLLDLVQTTLNELTFVVSACILVTTNSLLFRSKLIPGVELLLHMGFS